MAKSREHDNPTLPAPALKAPREAAVLDGASVSFAWEAVEGALRYQLEVARDQDFQTLVVDRVLEGESSVNATESFATDGTLYFWRVLAGDDAGWSSGDHVESFVSATAEEAVGDVARPDERLGPYPELIRSASVEAAAEVTGEEGLYDRESEMGVEHEGVEAGQILGITLAIAASIVMIVIVLFQWTRIVEMETRVEAAGISGYPELHQNELEAQRMIREYGVVDGEAGVYRVPVERAMELMVQEAREAEDSVASTAFPAR